MVKKLSNIGFFVLSAVLLTIIQSPFNISIVAWIALVPFVVGCLISEKVWPTVLAAYLISLVYWLGNLYWLILVTIPGGIVFCIYMALYWPILAICLRYCRIRKVPFWFVLPILVVGAEAFQGLCFRGFDWRYLGHSQYTNISIIQIADIFGAAGLSFLVAMVNGLIADIVISHKDAKTQRINNANIIGILITLFVLIATIFYGLYRVNQTRHFLVKGPKIGVVQSNVAVKAGRDAEPIEDVFLNVLRDSRDCLLTAGPAIIIWPETMVEEYLDDSFLNLISEDETAKIFNNALVRHSNEGRVYILVGAFSGNAEVVNEKIVFKTSYNSAFLYEPNTPKRQLYSKIHLVPFGEYIPFKKTFPFLNKFLMSLTPYDFDYTLDAGSEYTVFKMKDAGKEYKFGVMICYEDTVPKIARKLTLDKDKNKQVDWLVNISNDGWFVRGEREKIKPTSELEQHMAICVFRAVENRVPVVRSVNTGISCYIDSLGRIHNDYANGTLAKDAADRAGQKGWFADQVFMDKRITIFSQIGQNLEIGCGVCFIFTFLWIAIKKGRYIKQESKTEGK